jgi:bifunctional pyridoxal-dependent enzyme with beta-cystathionase and maltose regulon repressor activities
MKIFHKIKNYFCKTDQYDKTYITRNKNNFEEVAIPINANKTINDLDTDKITVWICDRDFKLIHATNDYVNDLNEHEYLGKFIYNVYPKDLAQYLYNLHQLAQKGEDSSIDLVLNGHLVYLTVRSLRYSDNHIFASVVNIVPYKY